MNNITIIGAGKGGHAAAGHAKLKGKNVTLWNRPGDKIEYLKENPEITIEGKLNGKVMLDCVTDSLEEAVDKAEVISVMTTSDIYEDIAVRIAPFLQDRQKLLLNCGGIGGALLFSQTILDQGYNPDITIGETDTCVYGCKMPEIGRSFVKSIKNRLYFTAFPEEGAEDFLDALRSIYPQFEHVRDPLAVGLWDATCFHTAGVVLNDERIRKGEKFLFYIDGVTPEIGEYMEEMDAERVAVARGMGLPTETAMEWLNSAYGIEMDSLQVMLHNNEPYKYNAFAPTTFSHRYLLEEVPTKLVPQMEMAQVLGIPQPLTREISERACELTGIDFFQEGRTLKRLGLLDSDIENYAARGIRPYIERRKKEKYEPLLV